MPTVAGWGIKTGQNKSGTNKSGVKAAVDYIKDENKTVISNDDLQNKKESLGNIESDDKDLNMLDGDGVETALGYVSNPHKTQNGEHKLVSGINCDPDTATSEFTFYADKYHAHEDEHLAMGQRANQAIHFYQSFKGNDLDPEEVHKMGVEFALRVCGGSFQAVVATHLNTNNYHNHILINAYSIDERNGRAYKWHQTYDKVKELRAISDEIAKEHGIPIITRQDGRGTDYKEWMSIQSGESWKEQLRKDIDNTRDVSRDWADYKRYMESAGYTITENRHSITYTMPGSGLKVSDLTLGKRYTKPSLEVGWKNKMAKKEAVKLKEAETEEEFLRRRKSFEDKTRVCRYTSYGRRRSELEMIFLLTLKIIIAVFDLFSDPYNEPLYPHNPIYRHPSWKVKTMLESIRIANEEHIESKENLSERLNDIGIELNKLSAQNDKDYADLGRMEETAELSKKVLPLFKHLSEIGFPVEDLPLPDISEREEKYAAALQCPMDKHQSQKLHELLEKNPTYHIQYQFSEISTVETSKIIDFLSDPENKTKPDGVLNDSEWTLERLKRKYQKRLEDVNQRTKENNSGPITQGQLRKLTEMRSDPKYSEDLDGVDLEHLTKFDAMKIIGYLTMENPLITSKSSAEQRSDQEKIRDTDIKQIDELFLIHPEIRPEKAPDFSNWTHSDANRLISYILEHDNRPEILPDKKKKKFEEKIQNYSFEDQEYIGRTLNILTSLSKIGLRKKEDIEKYLEVYEVKTKQLEINAAAHKKLREEYSKLKRLAYNLNLAENPKFAYGPKFESDRGADIKNFVQYIEEHNPVLEQEDRQIDDRIKQEETENAGLGYTQKDEYFEEKSKDDR